MANYLYNGAFCYYRYIGRLVKGVDLERETNLLPTLPEWDKEAYPYAYIETVLKFGTGIYYRLVASPVRPYVSNEFHTREGYYLIFPEACTVLRWTGGTEQGVKFEWGEPTATQYLTETIYSDTLCWSNFDILFDDGTVRVVGVEPVPITAPCLYDGVQHPAFPKWIDTEIMPYALIYRNTLGEFVFTMTSCPYCVVIMDNGTIAKPTDEYVVSHAVGAEKAADISWWHCVEYTNSYSYALSLNITQGEELLWSNYDILTEDRTVYFAAGSDPIPVGGEPIDPTSLLMGYRVGQMIRGMRNRPKEDV